MATSQKNRMVDSPAEGVRDRLLDVAEELFAERGFEGTSVRELAGAAGCNIASVNYYYGGKEKLYEEVWRRHMVLLRDTQMSSIDKVTTDSGGNPSLEELLRAFACAFVGPLVESGGRRMIGLMDRELGDPHLPSGMFGEEVMKPILNKMQQVLARACPGLDGSKVPLVVFSLVGQLIHAIRIKPILKGADEEARVIFDPARLIDHIVTFSAAGIRAYVERKTE